MVKPRSEQAGKKQPNKADLVAVEKLTESMADKPYGSRGPETGVQESIERLTIALPVSLYDEVEALAKRRRRAGDSDRSMSAIARVALREYLDRQDG